MVQASFKDLDSDGDTRNGGWAISGSMVVCGRTLNLLMDVPKNLKNKNPIFVSEDFFGGKIHPSPFKSPDLVPKDSKMGTR